MLVEKSKDGLMTIHVHNLRQITLLGKEISEGVRMAVQNGKFEDWNIKITFTQEFKRS